MIIINGIIEGTAFCTPIIQEPSPSPNASAGPQSQSTFGVILRDAILPCPADCVPEGGNDQVNIDDLLGVLNSFGTTDVSCDIAPLHPDGTVGNGTINIDDLIAALNAFGACP
ncbi:MAG: GC-type dockerin domain-anchored protein [Planctomycetota bacterium]